jgi:hypothetical protein
MCRAAHDAAQSKRADLLRLERVADVVLDELAGPPTRHIQIPVVDRQIDIGYERCHGLEPLQERRQLLRVGGLRGNRDDLLEPRLQARNWFSTRHMAKGAVSASSIFVA